MKVIDKKISELIQAEYNPRKLSDKQFRELRDSLNRFGFVDPVLVNVNEERKNIIIGGHQRTKVWESMGNDTVPVVELDLTLDQEKELNVRLNKSGGEFDFDMLQEHFDTDSLVEWGFNDYDFSTSGMEIDEEDFGEDFSLPDGEKEPFQQQTYTLGDKQAELIKEAIKEAKKLDEYNYIETFGNENSNGNALYLIVSQWEEQRK